MKNLVDLTNAYEREFTRIIKAYVKQGYFYGHPKYTREYYYAIREVCRELCIDTDEIEEGLTS